MGFLTKPVTELVENFKEYMDLRLQEFKLRAAKGLSVSLSQMLSIILVMLASFVAIIALAAGLAMVLGKIIGSYAGGAFIVAGIFACLAVVLFFLKGKLFSNVFVKLFVGAFFEDDDECKKEDEEE